MEGGATMTTADAVTTTQSRSKLYSWAGLAALIGLALAGAGAAAWWYQARVPKPGTWLAITPAVQSTGELLVNQTRDVSFTITNRHPTQPLRLLGAADSCGPQGCPIVESLPITVPPAGSVPLVVEYKSFRPGQFTCDVPLYTDSPGQFEMHLSIMAHVTEPPSGTSAGAPSP
jgi:hypothetical protein